MVRAKSKRLPIRIELKPEIRYSTCQGILLTDLYAVEPGNGAGTELMNLLAKLADEAGFNIYVNAEGPRSAAFYEKMGYVRDSSGHHQFVKYASFDHDEWLNESYVMDGNHRVREAKRQTHIAAYVIDPEDEGENQLMEAIEPTIAKEILTDYRCKRGVKVGKNAKFWRGQSSVSGSGMASFGLGYYFTANKRVAAQYAGDDGEVVQVWPTMLPDNALRFVTTGDWQIWLQRAQRLLGYKDNRDFVKDFDDIGVFVRSLDPSIEGIQMFTGNDAMFVSWVASRPDPRW
jgi:hypothetical protein